MVSLIRIGLGGGLALAMILAFHLGLYVLAVAFCIDRGGDFAGCALQMSPVLRPFVF